MCKVSVNDKYCFTNSVDWSGKQCTWRSNQQSSLKRKKAVSNHGWTTLLLAHFYLHYSYFYDLVFVEEHLSYQLQSQV